jgi:hypothetical protein
LRVGRGRSVTIALSGICSRAGGRAASRVGSFNSGISRAMAGFSFGMAVFSRRGGEFLLAILTGAFVGRRGASLGAGDGLVWLSSGDGGGSKETAIDSWGLVGIEGLAHTSNKKRCKVREATKKRTRGVFREATQTYYCTTHMLSK